MRDQTPTSIPNFIAAGSPLGLRRLMLINNARMGAHVRYFDIQFIEMNGRKQWVAWFYENLENDRAVRELSSATT